MICLNGLYLTFVIRYKQRDVAQLVARHVRDVEVGSSSLLIPTAQGTNVKSHWHLCLFRLGFSCFVPTMAHPTSRENARRSWLARRGRTRLPQLLAELPQRSLHGAENFVATNQTFRRDKPNCLSRRNFQPFTTGFLCCREGLPQTSQRGVWVRMDHWRHLGGRGRLACCLIYRTFGVTLEPKQGLLPRKERVAFPILKQ